jgi:hypothetical protein
MMPTLYKPILNEPESVWSLPARIISVQVLEKGAEILEALSFYEAHGRVGEWDGKFDSQIRRAEVEVLEELSGVLTFAADRAAAPRIGEEIATLEWIKKYPSLVKGSAVPSFAEWRLVGHYQRGDEAKGTNFPDIMGFLPSGFRNGVQVPEENRIFAAACAAIDELSEYRSPGRPSSEATNILAEGLRSIFSRYNAKITRCSVTSWRNGKFVQVEAGAFFDFVSVAIVPLQNVLRERKLAPVTPESIVRLGRYPISSISTHFPNGSQVEDASEARQPAATTEANNERIDQ